MKTIDQMNLKNKKVLIRVDFNVPMMDGKITSNNRIVEALPTIKYALEQNAKVILLSHLGKIKSEEDLAKKSLKIVSEELSKLLNLPVIFCPATSGQTVIDAVDKLKDGEILMLENTRFEDLNEKAESKNAEWLGKFWASLGDVYINDAFGTCHRSHASNVGIANNIDEVCCGFLVDKELKMLLKAAKNPEHPAVAIIGGGKIYDKFKVINNMLQIYDKVIIGGGMAYTFLKARGYSIGDSIFEPDCVEPAKQLLAKYKDKLVLPVDNAISKEFVDAAPQYNTEVAPNIPDGYSGLDIGPKTIELFTKALQGAKTVVWNGPLGVCEFKNYQKGTEAIAKAIAELKNVYSIVGGGDSAAAIMNLKLEKHFTHISTGGGASLCLLEGTPLPAIEVILNK